MDAKAVETGFTLPVLELALFVSGVTLILFILGYFAYKKKVMGAFFVGIIAFGIWALSAGMNMFTGWTTGMVIGIGGAFFGALFLLFTEFIVPVALVYRNTTGNSLPFIVLSSIVLGIGLSVFSFWNGTSMSLNTHFANMVKAGGTAEALRTEIAANHTGELKLSVTPEQSVTPLLRQIKSMESQPANNLAGQRAFRGGEKLTVATATYGCTSGVYYTSEKLYASTCRQIKSLKRQVADIRAKNKSIPKDVAAVEDKQKERAELQRQLSQRIYEKNTTLPFIDVLVSQITQGVNCSPLDIPCLEKQRTAVKQVSNSVALYIAIFSELMKNAFVFLALGLLFPNKRKPVTIVGASLAMALWVLQTPTRLMQWWASLKELETKTKAEAHGQREAELAFEKKMLSEKRERKVLILEAVPWMQNIVMEQLVLLLDMDKVMLGRTVSQAEVSLLLILICREYSPNKQIPLHQIMKDIKHRAAKDETYVRNLAGGMNIPHEDIIEQVIKVCKLHRLRDIVLPALEGAGLTTVKYDSESRKIYYWQSVEHVETSFKLAIKRKQEAEEKENG